MAMDLPRAVPQPVLEPAAQDVAVPAPRPPLDPAARDIPRPGPRPPLDPVVHDIPRPASRPVQGSRAGWILSTVVAVGAAWVVGWLAGVAWAWRQMAPWPLSRTPGRSRASLPGAGSPLRS